MNPENPYFSLIVPTYERLNQLKKCLESITRLDYPKDKFEVIVVDDGCGIKTLEDPLGIIP